MSDNAQRALSELPATNTHRTQEIERNLARELDEQNQSGRPYVSAMDVRWLLDELYRTTELAMRRNPELLKRVRDARIEAENGTYGDEKPWTWKFYADLLRAVETELETTA